MQYSLYIGRFQPFHGGHQAIVRRILSEGKNALIAIRDTAIDTDNPYTSMERFQYISQFYADNDRVKVIVIPDILEVCYGRGVGYGIREIRLDASVEKISATEIRKTRIRLP